MEPLVIAFIVMQALLLGIAAGFAIVRGRALGRIRELLAQDAHEPSAGAATAAGSVSAAGAVASTGADSPATIVAGPVTQGVRAGRRANVVASGPDGPFALSEDEIDAIDVEQGVRALLERTRSAEWEARQVAWDRSTLLDILGIGTIRLDDDLRVEAANAAAHLLLGRPPGSLVGLTAIEAFIDPAIESIAVTARELGLAGGEFTLRKGEGTTIVVRARRSPVRGVWLVMEDVSELRRLQRIRTEFIDNLSHELRTPLTTVSLLAETLVREAEGAGEALPARMRDRIGKIEVETDHLVQMVNELLDLSRIESGGPMLLLDQVDLGRLAAASVERLRLFAERQGVTLRTEIPDVVPPVRGAEDRLGQVLVNLLHNAVKFSPDGGDVTVRVEAGPDEVTVSVEDHGIGIARADQARVFERFYKADKARSRGGGTGLGLAISRHVINGHGGRIRVESEEGRGSTFSFAIPRTTSEGH